MSKSNNDKPVFPRVRPGSDNFISEAAKEFSLKGERTVLPSTEGTDKNDIISVESQMSGTPVYTRKKTEDK